MGYGPQREYEDRNWYYQPDRQDDRNRYNDKYPNRYGSSAYYQQQQLQQPQANRYERPAPYERNDYRQNYQDYRGNGYDNRDPMYYQQMKGGSYGNRGDSGAGGAGGYGAGGAGGYGAGGAGGYGAGGAGGYDAGGAGGYDGKLVNFVISTVISWLLRIFQKLLIICLYICFVSNDF